MQTSNQIFTSGKELFEHFTSYETYELLSKKKMFNIPRDEREQIWRTDNNISENDWKKFLEYKAEKKREAEIENKHTEQLKFNERQRKITEIIKSSKVPKIFRNKSKKDFIITEKNKIAIECLQAINHNQGFYIYGECGTGKTLLASIIQNERAHQLKSSMFICATDIFSELNPYNSNTEEVYRKLSLLKNTPCLIIDDLGVEKPTDRVKQNLFDIINYRYNENLQTIITSNFSIEELSARISGISSAEIGRKKISDYEGNRIIRRISAICSIIKLENY